MQKLDVIVLKIAETHGRQTLPLLGFCFSKTAFDVEEYPCLFIGHKSHGRKSHGHPFLVVTFVHVVETSLFEQVVMLSVQTCTTELVFGIQAEFHHVVFARSNERIYDVNVDCNYRLELYVYTTRAKTPSDACPYGSTVTQSPW